MSTVGAAGSGIVGVVEFGLNGKVELESVVPFSSRTLSNESWRLEMAVSFASSASWMTSPRESKD